MGPKVSIIIPVYNVETYIEDMLKSVESQSFKCYEALIVNDGSTDDSQSVIDKFCDRDPRFISIKKENGGVASARNLGIERAGGEYAVFYDPDDFIPKNALEKMYRTASSKKADIVVGVMKEISLGEPLIYMHSQKLAQQNRISPLDQHFFGAWSLCHKMFSLDFIRKNNLKVEKLKNAEDGVFTFCALNCTDKIYGCDSVAYNYYKRPFWLTPSATQTISADYLDGLLQSHDRILNEARRLASSKMEPEEAEIYLQKLYIRFIEGEMINGYYRGIWRASDDLVPAIEARTDEYRKHITEGQWAELVKRHSDLELEKGYITAEEMAESPLITVILSAVIAANKINLMLGSLYNQNFPRFQVIVPKERQNEIDPAYREKKNIKFAEGEGRQFKENSLAASKGRYIIIADEFTMFTRNTLSQMEKVLHSDDHIDFVSVLVKNFDGQEYNDLRFMNAAYGYTPMSKKRDDIFTSGDIFMSNKLIRKSSLKDFEFSNCGAKDAAGLYKKMKFRKIRRGVMITDMADDDIFTKAVKKPYSVLAGLNGRKNMGIESAVRKLKRVITREDIDRMKRMLKKK